MLNGYLTAFFAFFAVGQTGLHTCRSITRNDFALEMKTSRKRFFFISFNENLIFILVKRARKVRLFGKNLKRNGRNAVKHGENILAELLGIRIKNSRRHECRRNYTVIGIDLARARHSALRIRRAYELNLVGRISDKYRGGGTSLYFIYRNIKSYRF